MACGFSVDEVMSKALQKLKEVSRTSERRSRGEALGGVGERWECHPSVGRMFMLEGGNEKAQTGLGSHTSKVFRGLTKMTYLLERGTQNTYRHKRKSTGATEPCFFSLLGLL